MRTLTLFLAGALLAAAPATAQNTKSDVIFDAYEWDFGAIDAINGTVCHTFTFQNKSDNAVRIGKTIPSCDCITAHYSTDEVQPGDIAKVMVAFSPAGAAGRTHRSVELLDQNGKTLGALSTKAHVTTSEKPEDGHKYPFQDYKLSNEERVENLLSLLTPEEKVGLMMNKSISVDRLGIPSYNWWNEACHGVRQGGYTVYPQPIGMAAAFNSHLRRPVYRHYAVSIDPMRYTGSAFQGM